MPDIVEYVHEKLDRLADRILELLTGLSGYRMREVKARIPEVRKITDARLARRLGGSGPTCDRY